MSKPFYVRGHLITKKFPGRLLHSECVDVMNPPGSFCRLRDPDSGKNGRKRTYPMSMQSEDVIGPVALGICTHPGKINNTISFDMGD